MKNALHFVRFDNAHDERYRRAVQLFGEPDFMHRFWDHRVQREIAAGDVIVFAKGDADQPINPFSFDDSAYA